MNATSPPARHVWRYVGSAAVLLAAVVVLAVMLVGADNTTPSVPACDIWATTTTATTAPSRPNAFQPADLGTTLPQGHAHDQRDPTFRPCRTEDGRYLVAHFHNGYEVSQWLPTESPTPAQRDAAIAFAERSRATTVRYKTASDALADGYIRWTHVDQNHLVKPEFMTDGRVLDPDRPESLVIDDNDNITAAMFVMPSADQHGVQFGGPLTVWHFHDFGKPVCFGYGGIELRLDALDAAGNCAAGTQKFPHSSEMLHVWLAGPAAQSFNSTTPGT